MWGRGFSALRHDKHISVWPTGLSMPTSAKWSKHCSHEGQLKRPEEKGTEAIKVGERPERGSVDLAQDCTRRPPWHHHPHWPSEKGPCPGPAVATMMLP